MGQSLINPNNQKGLRHVFEIKDTQLNPEHVDMGAVQPVIDMNFGGNATLNNYDLLQGCTEPGSSVVGVQTKTWRILSYVNASGVDQQIVVPPNHNFLIWGIKCHLYFNAAGAAAIAGKYFSIEIKMICPDSGSTEVSKYHGTNFGYAGCLLYGLGGLYFRECTKLNMQVIPADCVLEITTWVQDGTNFPNSCVMVYSIVGQAFPVGAPAPWCV